MELELKIKIFNLQVCAGAAPQTCYVQKAVQK